jgi:two-component system chemotaxis response regulator CheY
MLIRILTHISGAGRDLAEFIADSTSLFFPEIVVYIQWKSSFRNLRQGKDFARLPARRVRTGKGSSMPKSVVIIDDSQYMVDVLTKFFKETMELNVVGASTNGMDAIELYRTFQPDLLSLDISMPNKTGVDVIKEILQEFPYAAILMVSAIRDDYLLDCLRAGAVDVVSKPLDFNDPVFVEKFKNIVEQIFA